VLTKYHPDDKIKNIEMGWTCGTYRGQERCMQGFGGKTCNNEITLEDWAWMSG
jgi:hypothetical protein